VERVKWEEIKSYDDEEDDNNGTRFTRVLSFRPHPDRAYCIRPAPSACLLTMQCIPAVAI
jgi:hypothetical protein